MQKIMRQSFAIVAFHIQMILSERIHLLKIGKMRMPLFIGIGYMPMTSAPLKNDSSFIMSCYTPHYRPAPKKKQPTHNNRDYERETKCFVDYQTQLPWFRPSAVTNPATPVTTPTPVTTAEELRSRTSFPVPVFPPTDVQCGRGAEPVNARDPDERRHNIAMTRFGIDSYTMFKADYRDQNRKRRYGEMNETNASIGGCKKADQMTTINFVKNKNESKDPITYPFLRNFKTYEADLRSVPSAPFAGSNLVHMNLGTEKYLLYSTPENGGSLRLICAPKDDSYHPQLSHASVHQTNGQIYQISTSKKLEEQPTTFVTRHLKHTTIWSASDQCGHFPFSAVVSSWDDSVVRCVEARPFEPAEFCELRTDSLNIGYEDRYTYKHKLSRKFNTCHYGRMHTQQVLLVDGDGVWQLDCRTGQLEQSLRIDDEGLVVFFNMSDGQKIRSFTPMDKEHAFCMCTDKFVLIWDERMRKTPLYKNTHMMRHAPSSVSTVADGDLEWILMNSSVETCATMAVRWSTPQLYAADTARIEVGPVRRPGVLDTLEHVEQLQLLDWSFTNRFKQRMTGMTCYKEDETIRIWTASGAGDVFLQNIYMTDSNRMDIADSGLILDLDGYDFGWINGWTQDLTGIDGDSTKGSATEFYNAREIVRQMYAIDNYVPPVKPAPGQFPIDPGDLEDGGNYLAFWDDSEDGEWKDLPTI